MNSLQFCITRRLFFGGFIALLFLSAIGASVDANNWTANGSDNLWTTVENWSQGVAPLNATSHPNFGWDDPTGPFYPLTTDTSDDGAQWNNDALLSADGATILIDSSVTATTFGVRIGLDGASNTLEMTGGTLQVGGFPPNDTSQRTGWHLDVGRGYNRSTNPDPVARMVMTGGVVDTNLIKVPEGFVDGSLADPYDTPGLNGELLMSGGVMNGRKLNVGQFTGNGLVEMSGDAVLNLWPTDPINRNNGGFFEMKQTWFIDGQPVATDADAHLDIRGDAIINIFGKMGQFEGIPDQSEVDRMQQYVNDGWLTANNGADDPILTLQSCPTDGSLDQFCVNGGQMMITITAPAPTTTAVGDFDTSGTWDCADINALIQAIATASNDLSFDVNGDSAITIADRDAWMVAAGAAQLASGNPYLLGDLDLNGSVTSTDLGVLLNNFAANGAVAYCGGDIDANSQVTSTDLGLLLNNFGASSAVSTVAVPEPNGLTLLAILVGCFLPVLLRPSKRKERS